MSGDSQEFRRDLQAQDPNAIVVGDKVWVQGLTAGGRLFVFTRYQMQFLLALQKLKNPEAAAISIGQTAEWAKSFLAGRKFKSYVADKMAEFSTKNGMTVEWWYQFGKWLTEGARDFYQAHCPGCQFNFQMNTYEAEAARDDEMVIVAECPVCTYKPLEVSLKSEPFRPTREQVEGWKEVGSRILPKVERVHHEFSKEEFSFETAG